ncbi:adhesion G-protein coupled receptor G6-like isoform X1 [Babylonia areolata]|uniref:adhesion G-protein coupled receptor G6-like isoform X1 n=1 Tax=Babylonia areolata TaxID=304850 RepID=UPI003FD3F8B9
MGKYVNVGLVPLLFLIILFTGCSTTCSSETLLTATSFYTVLRSPNYPGNYSNNQECGWKIRTGNWGYIVRLYVFDVSLEESDNCDHDSLSIYDGGHPSSYNLLAKLCGTKGLNNFFSSSGRWMYLKFKSDSTLTFRGFELRFRAITRTRTTIRPWPTTTPSSDGTSTDRQNVIIWTAVCIFVLMGLIITLWCGLRRKEPRQASRSTTSSTTPPRVPGVGANSSSQHGVYILPANQPSRPAETGTSHTNAAYSPEAGEPLPTQLSAPSLPDATIPMQMAEAGPPPSYSEVMREVTKPPSYEEAIGGR